MEYTQNDIDSAYAVKIYLDNHPHPDISVSLLAQRSRLPEERLRSVFFEQFHISLDAYRKQLLLNITSLVPYLIA